MSKDTCGASGQTHYLARGYLSVRFRLALQVFLLLDCGSQYQALLPHELDHWLVATSIRRNSGPVEHEAITEGDSERDISGSKADE